MSGMKNRKNAESVVSDSSRKILSRVIGQILPTVPAALLPAISSMAEAWFLSRLGSRECAAVGLMFPVHAAVQTVGFVAGTGGGSLTARAIGAGETDRVRNVMSASLFWAVVPVSVLAVPALLMREFLLGFLGADGTTAGLALPYLTFLLLSAPLMCGVFVLSNLIRSAGHTVLSFVGVAIANVLTVAGVPLLIFSFRAGLSGAGMAVLISYGSAFCFLLIGWRKTVPRIRFFPESVLSSLCTAGRSALNGLPSLFRQGLAVVAVLLTNRAARAAGTEALTAVAVSSRVFLLLYCFLLGIGQGILPCAGAAYGRGDGGRVRLIFRFALALSVGTAVLLSVPVLLFAPRIIGWFRSEPETIRLGAQLLRAQCAVLILHAGIVPVNLLLQGIGRTVPATLIAAARQGFFFLPLILLLPLRFGFSGIVAAQPCADVTTFLLTLPFLLALFLHPPAPKKQKDPFHDRM